MNAKELRHMIKSALLVERLVAEAKDEEAKDKKTKDEETEDTESTEDTGAAEGGEDNVKTVQDGLNAVMTAAQKLGDEKLIDQIGNTITFFTRTHVANTEKSQSSETPSTEAPAEEAPVTEILRFKKLAGLK